MEVGFNNLYMMKVMMLYVSKCYVFFFKQKTAYEMRISDWSSDVCSSDLGVQNSYIYFNVVFIVVLVSLVLQGWTVPWVARRLNVELPPSPEPATRQIGRASCRERVCQYV